MNNAYVRVAGMADKKLSRFDWVASWYYGNFCCMRCLREEQDLDRLSCHKKIREFMNDKSRESIAHKDFVKLVREQLKICDTKNFKKISSCECRVCRTLGIPQKQW
ncbi:hypothetical protein HY992_00395 [Candidatus Micrarchaeota archaeon]|nr:hypothetical protein [Candidatus Micrarchaeota archaeon]